MTPYVQGLMTGLAIGAVVLAGYAIIAGAINKKIMSEFHEFRNFIIGRGHD